MIHIKFSVEERIAGIELVPGYIYLSESTLCVNPMCVEFLRDRLSEVLVDAPFGAITAKERDGMYCISLHGEYSWKKEGNEAVLVRGFNKMWAEKDGLPVGPTLTIGK